MSKDVIFNFRCMCIASQGLGGCPMGTWVYAVEMHCQHLLVKIHSSRCTRRNMAEVAEITAFPRCDGESHRTGVAEQSRFSRTYQLRSAFFAWPAFPRTYRFRVALPSEVTQENGLFWGYNGWRVEEGRHEVFIVKATQSSQPDEHEERGGVAQWNEVASFFVAGSAPFPPKG